MDAMTFDEMVIIEPKLGELKDAVIKIMANSPGGYWERNKIWYQELKPRFKHLVGFMANKAELETCECYDAAYQELCRVLKVW